VWEPHFQGAWTPLPACPEERSRNLGGGVLRRERKYAIGTGGPQGSVDIFDAILLIVVAVGLTTFLVRLGS
jgi:hypothetical protein